MIRTFFSASRPDASPQTVFWSLNPFECGQCNPNHTGFAIFGTHPRGQRVSQQPMPTAHINDKTQHDVAIVDGTLSVDGVKLNFSHEFESDGALVFRSNDGLRHVRVRCIDADRSARTVTLRVKNHDYTVRLKSDFDTLLERLGMGPGSALRSGNMKAPMPGMVLEVMASPGQTVKKDDPLLILEAMKMENVIKSPQDGIIAKVGVLKGEAVEKGALLIAFEA